jgi:hypothetical protein
VDYPQNDFIATDLTFAKVWLHLVSEDTLKLIIQVYLKTGNYSLDSKLYSEYISNVKTIEIVEKHRELQRIAVRKAESVWKANVTFFALADVLQRYIELYLPGKDGGAGDTSADLGQLFTKIKSTIYNINRENFNKINIEYPVDVYLWFLNMIVESEVMERVLAMLNTIDATEGSSKLLSSFINSIEQGFAQRVGEEPEEKYTEEETYKALLMRAAELRGQYINKLRNAIIAVTDIVAAERRRRGPTPWREVIRDVMLRRAAYYIGEVLHMAGKPPLFKGFIGRIISENESFQARQIKTLLLASAIIHKKLQRCVVTPADMFLWVLKANSGFHALENVAASIAEEICGKEEPRDVVASAVIATNILLNVLPSGLFDVAAVREHKYATFDGRTKFDSVYIYDHHKILEHIRRILV